MRIMDIGQFDWPFAFRDSSMVEQRPVEIRSFSEESESNNEVNCPDD